MNFVSNSEKMNNGEAAEESGISIAFTNASFTGLLAKSINGGIVVLEHRYWGKSIPYNYTSLTTETLQHLTLENAIADGTYFARNVQLPFDSSSSSNAPQAPWVLSGGSYAGALSAWTASTSPGTFWAYHASSAPVEAIKNFWSYNLPIQNGMPQNCSKDITRVVNYVDAVLDYGSDANKTELKTMFGLQKLEHDDDFAAALWSTLGSWQDLQPYSGYTEFFMFCDSIESGGTYFTNSSNSSLPGPDGVGLDTALKGYAAFLYSQYGSNPELAYEYFDTYNGSVGQYSNTKPDVDAGRQWMWLLCDSPFDYWQGDGFPIGLNSLVSRHVNGTRDERACKLTFPDTNGFTLNAKGNTTHDINAWTGGWRFDDSTRLTWTNGEFDPWRSAGVSSEIRPAGPLQSTPAVPVNIVPGGVHCWDLWWSDPAPAYLKEVVDTELATVAGWVAEFYNGTSSSSSSGSSSGQGSSDDSSMGKIIMQALGALEEALGE